MTFNSNVLFLERDDVTATGDLKHSALTKGVVVVFVWASWCPHCDNAKPAYQTFANMYAGQVTAACVHAYGKPSEKELGEVVSRVWDIQGFPDYKLFVDGKLQQTNIQHRTVKGLEAFVAPFLQ